MEAIPKLPMLYFELKMSPSNPDFAGPFKSVSSRPANSLPKRALCFLAAAVHKRALSRRPRVLQ